MSWFPTSYTYFALLIIAALIFHGMLWLRNGRFLWRNRGLIFTVVALAEVWMLVTDPIGGQWGTWYFAADKVVGLWFLTVMPIEDFFAVAVVSSAAACAILVFGYGPRRWI